MKAIFVVGRFSRTVYGPFESEPKAQSFIRTELGSSTRFYDTTTDRPTSSARSLNYGGVFAAPKGPRAPQA